MITFRNQMSIEIEIRYQMAQNNNSNSKSPANVAISKLPLVNPIKDYISFTFFNLFLTKFKVHKFKIHNNRLNVTYVAQKNPHLSTHFLNKVFL